MASPADMPGAVIPATFIELSHDQTVRLDGEEMRPLMARPPFGAPPARQAAVALTRDQYCRRVALTLAVQHWADLECKPAEVLDTAREWADWIRTGKVRTEGELQCEKPA